MTLALTGQDNPFEGQKNLGWNRNCILVTETILAYLKPLTYLSINTYSHSGESYAAALYSVAG